MRWRELPPEDRVVLAAYEAALREAAHTRIQRAARRQLCAGGATPGPYLRGARRLLRRGVCRAGPAGARFTAEEVLTILADRSRGPIAAAERVFLGWLALTGRRPFPPDVLEALEERVRPTLRWLELGRLAHPALVVRLIATAQKLGYRQTTAELVATLVTRAAAYAGKAPEALTVADLVRVSAALRQRQAARRAERGGTVRRERQPLQPWMLASVLYHAGILAEPPPTGMLSRGKAHADAAEAQLAFLRERWPRLHAVAARYVTQRRSLVKPATVAHDALAVGTFLRWLTQHAPTLATLTELDRRTHLEPYLRWVAEEAGPGRRRGETRWARGTQRGMVQGLERFLDLVTLWGWPDVPARPLLLPGDVPRLPRPLPRAFDDVEAARMVQAAREAATPLERVVVELLAGCGLRAGEAHALQLSDLVTFGSAGHAGSAGNAGAPQPLHPASQPWLRVPLGKLGNDRYVPVGPELQAALDAFLAAERSSRDWEDLPTPPSWTRYLLAHKGRRVSTMYCNRIVHRFAALVGVADAHAHRWRHTFATQAINRGMDVATIATLLGHTTLEMTMLYARIANPTLRREFERVSRQVQAFYTVAATDPPTAEAPVVLPAGALGPAMTVTRRELEWRRLGNGWCTRRAYLDCRYELVCERCVHFNTDRLFLPVLQAQRDDAARKGQQARVDVLGTLIAAVQATPDGGTAPVPVTGPREADFSEAQTKGLA